MPRTRGFGSNEGAKHEQSSCGWKGSPEGTRTTDPPTQKTPKVHSSFRINPVVEVFSKFEGEKEWILKRMSFDGLLHLPKGEGDTDRPFKLQFSYWLLTALESITGILEFGKRGSIPLVDGDVGFVLGLKSTGELLDIHDPTKLEDNKNIIRRNLMLEHNEEIDFESIKKVLKRDISGEEDRRNAFMTAVVIYAVSFFLAPKGRPPKINAEIFDSITDPRRILRLNWSAYVLKILRESSCKVKADILAQKSSVCLDGCLLFLQIVYLDNLKNYMCSGNQCIVPRVADYSYEKLKNYINMDKLQSTKGSGERYGKLELRKASESFYAWGGINQDKEKTMEDNDECSNSYNIDSLLQYIDQENFENKRKIRNSAMAYADQLCRISDRRNEEVKSYVTKWISEKLWREKQTKHQANETVDPFKEGTSSRSNAANRGKQKIGPDVIDLTGNDDEEEQMTTRRVSEQSGKDAHNEQTYEVQRDKRPCPVHGKKGNGEKKNADGLRQGTKRTASRETKAERKAQLHATHNVDIEQCITGEEEKDGQTRKHGEKEGAKKDSGFENIKRPEKRLRTKLAAHKTHQGIKKKIFLAEGKSKGTSDGEQSSRANNSLK